VQSMAGQVALVTGGASGIGRAAATTFAREGAAVVVADIAEQGGEVTVQMVEDLGGESLFVRTDVLEPADLQNVVAQALSRFGRLDAALNNVGHPGYYKDAVDTTEEEWDHVAQIDVRSVWLSMKYQIPAMLETGGGAIVNTASAAVFRVTPQMAAFTSFKHAVVGLTQSVARDFAARNIRANVLCPGVTATPMMLESVAKLGDGTIQGIEARIPMGRMAKAEEQAEAAVWLCSPRSSYVTGTVLLVDGGLTL
jgi:NAD(P)-dependent dehydrogenase (short-subunit alcohol dehydrogenase family)